MLTPFRKLIDADPPLDPALGVVGPTTLERRWRYAAMLCVVLGLWRTGVLMELVVLLFVVLDGAVVVAAETVTTVVAPQLAVGSAANGGTCESKSGESTLFRVTSPGRLSVRKVRLGVRPGRAGRSIPTRPHTS